MPAILSVIATAGHVDHGKSSLIVALTGIDPDRFAEEKRRGLTIDLGYAWTTLPSGREVGFVDVPGHERFIGNMLAGVGPVRLVLFVVAADEGWKPQSEEHLQILDVLGLAGGVIALTKRDLVDAETLEIASMQIRERVAGTALAAAPIVAVSSRTGEGADELTLALDRMLAEAPSPEPGRARLFIDRAFTIKGAGTVVTGTLTGDCLAADDDVQLWPNGREARIRSLQTHKREETRACPVMRVAANLVGAEREQLSRGDVLARPGSWRPTETIEAALEPVRGLGHPITARGAFKLYAGAAETGAGVRIYGGALDPDARAFARIRLARPMVLDVFDRFVLREAGRRETVAGGIVLDVAPPRRPGADPATRLGARQAASRAQLPALLAAERGAISGPEAEILTGEMTQGPARAGWLIRPDVGAGVREAVREVLARFHGEHPLQEGLAVAEARRVIAAELRREGAPTEPDLTESLLGAMDGDGTVVRMASTVRLPSHEVALDAADPQVARLVITVGASPLAPPSLNDLGAKGFGREVIDAAARAGVLVRVSVDLVFTPEALASARSVVKSIGQEGITVSAFREALGTSRKYALPLLEYFDAQGVTRREGDLRFLRGSAGT